MHTSQDGRRYIESKEGCRLTAYRPMHGTDVWTIGYGHTGPDVEEGLVWSQGDADTAMEHDLATRYEPAVNRVCQGVATMQGQFDAMVSLAYNIGAGAFATSSVARFHRAGEFDKAADAFELFDHYHGEVNEALHNRRVEEAQTYLDATPEAVRTTADAPESVLNKDFYSSPTGVLMTPMGSDPVGQQKAVVATMAGPGVGVAAWYLNQRRGLGIPEHVVADLVGLFTGALVWITPHGGKR